MRLFLVSALSLLAASSCANAAAVAGYPYRSELLAYSPARGEFPVVNALTPGYVRFIDQQGVEHLVGYKYPAPVQSRRDSNEEYLYQLAKESLKKEGAEYIQARNEHLRLWAIDQYVRYRQESDRLKLAGQQPTAELIAKINALEVLNNAIRKGVDIENPATKSLREEHTRLWDESRRSAQQVTKPLAVATATKPTIYLRVAGAEQEFISKADPTQPQIAVVGETPEQKKVREEHLRLYQEQLQRVQGLQADSEKSKSETLLQDVRIGYAAGKYEQELQIKEQQQQQQIQQQQQQRTQQEQAKAQGVKIVENLSYIQETPEVQQAKAEHLRLWHEAKLRADKEEQANEKHGEHHSAGDAKEGRYNTQFLTNAIPTAVPKQTRPTYELQQLQQLSTYTTANEPNMQLKTDANPQVPTPVQDTPEVQRARAEHFRILEELQKKADFIADIQPNSEIAAQPAQQQATQENISEYVATTKSITTDVANSQSQPQAQIAVQETEEVKRAREEHLKLVKEAHLKASQYQTEITENAAAPKPTFYLATTADKTTDEHADEETRLRAEEVKQRQTELLAETARLREEQRLQAEELLRLQQEEQRRQEQERLDLAAENKDAENYAEKTQLPIIVPATKDTLDQLIQTQLQTGSDSAVTYDIRDSEKYATNPYLLRYAIQTPSPQQLGKPIAATTAYFLGAQQSAQQQQSYGQPGVYYLRDASDSYIKLDNPYFLHYITNQQGGKEMLATADAASLASALSALHQGQGQRIEQPIAPSFADKPIAPIIPIASLPSSAQLIPNAPIASSAPLTPITSAPPALPSAPISPSAPGSANMKIFYGNEAALAALEQATRDHFRAHEIALERLRLANQKQPAQKDCN
ncbi:trichohyalin [Ceratitis capitata]|uniref:(Mediterranean fruit fly) hypothetical protein n=1 Tax=Ceratitis capitata TaxID=7213 RepID=W8BI84_CERCA|nr:trichohyalin [Ceratitis capitata]CAD7013459.1 unnamed protein product [Ceratitis capitata]